MTAWSNHLYIKWTFGDEQLEGVQSAFHSAPPLNKPTRFTLKYCLQIQTLVFFSHSKGWVMKHTLLHAFSVLAFMFASQLNCNVSRLIIHDHYGLGYAFIRWWYFLSLIKFIFCCVTIPDLFLIVIESIKTARVRMQRQNKWRIRGQISILIMAY